MGIYQLYFLKMHSKLLFLSRNAGTKDPAFLSRVLADILAVAKEAMRGRNLRPLAIPDEDHHAGIGRGGCARPSRAG